MKTTKSINLRGINLSYSDIDSEAQSCYLFIHGNSSSKESFEPLYEYLTGSRLIAVDLPGHGHSDRLSNLENYNTRFIVDLLVEFVEALNLERVSLVGHSLGGHLVIELASIIEARLNHVFTWGTPPIASAEDLTVCFNPVPEAAPIFSEDGTDEQLQKLAASYIANSDFHASFINDYRKTDSNFRTYVFKGVAEGKLRDQYTIIKNTKTPVTLIHATGDIVLNSDYMKTKSEELTLANYLVSYKTIDSTHCAQIDNARDLSEILIQAITRGQESRVQIDPHHHQSY